MLLAFDMPVIDTGIDTPPEAAIAVIGVFYVIAGDLQPVHPGYRRRPPAPSSNPLFLMREFSHCVSCCGATSSARSRSRRRRCSGARARRCSSSCSNGPKWRSAIRCRRRRCCRASCASASRSGRRRGAVRPAAPRRRTSCRSASRWGSRHRDGLRHSLPVAIALMILIGALRGILRRADERAAAAPRPHPDGRRATRSRCRTSTRTSSILVMLGVYAAPHVANFSIYTVVVIFGLFVSSHDAAGAPAPPAQPAQGGMPVIPSTAALADALEA